MGLEPPSLPCTHAAAMQRRNGSIQPRSLLPAIGLVTGVSVDPALQAFLVFQTETETSSSSFLGFYLTPPKVSPLPLFQFKDHSWVSWIWSSSTVSGPSRKETYNQDGFGICKDFLKTQGWNTRPNWSSESQEMSTSLTSFSQMNLVISPH